MVVTGQFFFSVIEKNKRRFLPLATGNKKTKFVSRYSQNFTKNSCEEDTDHHYFYAAVGHTGYRECVDDSKMNIFLFQMFSINCESSTERYPANTLQTLYFLGSLRETGLTDVC